ncbi:single-stranded DNA-binding protein [Acinetobacter baumannii]|uniref:single-stranded DNA-binding protein n=1 Tax=Acinetobacter baumannii TaxID=470 RepID=UPI0009A8D6E6|nr:single-stranded DNA-binding protein [Acinetobacter baumannii]
MPNVNKVILMGVLGRDPETKQFPNGGSITTFSLATSEHWKDKTTNERKEATEWHRISSNGRLANISRMAVRHILRVHCVLGSGKTKNGIDREVTEIRADVLQLFGLFLLDHIGAY